MLRGLLERCWASLGRLLDEVTRTEQRAQVACKRLRTTKLFAFPRLLLTACSGSDSASGLGGPDRDAGSGDTTADTTSDTSAGNFYLSAGSSRIVMPYTARVTMNGRTYAMETETSNGDCNSCHTPGGNGDTQGRIVFL